MDSVQQTEQGAYVALDPQITQQILDKLQQELTRLTSIGLQPIILTSPIVRIYFRHLTQQYLPNLTILSYNEIDPNIEIQSIGMVSI